MAGLKGKSGPPGNMNAFKHGLAAIQKRREESIISRARRKRQAADSGRIDSRQGRGAAGIDGHQNFGRGYSQ